MDYVPAGSVRVTLRVLPLVAALGVAIVATYCLSAHENPAALVGLWGSLLTLGWIATATVLTHLLGCRDLVVKPPQHTADFHALSGFRVRVQLANERRRWPALFVTARLETVTEGVSLRAPPAVVACLGARTQAALSWDITVRKRGAVDLRGLHVETAFPGSITGERAHFPFSQQLLALPAVYRLDQRTLQLIIGRRRAGGHGGAAPASLEDFVGIREYRPGDNPRSIHIAVSLRLPEFPHQLAIREYEDPSTEDVCVVLDTHLANADDVTQRYRHEKSLSFAIALCRLLTEKKYSIRFRAIDGTRGALDLPVRWPNRDLPRLEAWLAKLRPTTDPAALQTLLTDSTARSSDALLFIALQEQSRFVSSGRTMLAIGPELQSSLVKEVVIT